MATRQIADFEGLEERKWTYCDADLSLPVREDLARVIAEAARHYQHARTILDRTMKDRAKLRARMEKVHATWVRNRGIHSPAQAFPGLHSLATFSQQKFIKDRKFVVYHLVYEVGLIELYSSALLQNARAKMITMSVRHPGSYVVVCRATGSVVARINGNGFASDGHARTAATRR